MLAHLVFRAGDGSFTAAGWYWMATSTLLLVLSTATFVAPHLATRPLRRLGPAPFITQKVWFVRGFAVLVAGLAIWFGATAILAGPGQLV
jgi:hypothetical protein